MDRSPLLKSKLVTPEIPDKALYSDRIKKLDIGVRKATIITAPAGFGKTTSVLLSLQKDRERIHWYRMEKEDSFLPVFYTHLIEAIFGHESNCSAESAGCLSSVANISEEYPLINAVICQDAWTLFPDTSKIIYIILDDYQNADGNAVIAESIRYFMSNLPPHFRIIIMSRTETAIPTVKHALNEDLLSIDESDLRFTRDEIESLASKVYKIKLGDSSIDRILEYTEGWITGIAMLSHIDESSVAGGGRLIPGNDGNMQKLFRLFLDEVLGKFDRNLIKRLAKLSVLPDFTSASLKAIFDLNNADEAIASLERSNICLQKIKSVGTSYRLHSLLRNALLSVLNELFTQAEIDEMNLRAAKYYKEQGDVTTAVRFFISGGRTEEAINLASEEGMRYMNAGNTDGLLPLDREFSEDVVRKDPYLLLFRGTSLMNSDFEESYSYLSKALLGFKRKRNIDLQMNAVGLIISMCYKRNDLDYIKSISQFIPKFFAVFASEYSRRALLLCAFMSTSWADRLSLAEAFLKLLSRYDYPEPVWDYMLNLSKGGILFREGRLQEADVIFRRLMNHSMTLTSDRLRILLLALMHNVVSHQGDIKTSEKLATELAYIGEKYGSEYARGHALRLTAYNKYQTLSISSAIAVSIDAEASCQRLGNVVMSHVIHITRLLWQAESEPAEPLAKQAAAVLEDISKLNPGQGFLELCQAITGALFKAAGDYNLAEQLLLSSFKACRKKNTKLNMCGIAMQLADIYYRKQAYRKEDEYLRLWAETSAKCGYKYFREMDYPTLVRVCSRCMEKRICMEYVKSILVSYFGQDSTDMLVNKPARYAVSPDAFLKSLASPSKSGKAIRIKLFGNFRVYVDGVEISESEWKTRKICGIMKYLLANPQKTVSREVLAAMFWPDSDPKAALTSLRAALYELRKTLARFDLAFESENAIISEDKNGFRLCGMDHMEFDTVVFTELYRKFKSKQNAPDETKKTLQKITELYEGDFLDGDLYEEWAGLTRDHYRSMFIEASYNLAKTYMADSEFEQAEALLLKHLEVDPFDETACGILIKLCNTIGQQKRASAIHRQFIKRFEAEMGIRPDLTC